MYWELEANLSSQHFSLAWTYFEGVNGLSLSSLKWFIPVEYSLGNTMASQLGSEVKETGIRHSLGAMLTIWLEDILGQSISQWEKARKTSSFPFFSLLLPSISSSLSVWSSVLIFLPLPLVRSFQNSGSDCSLTFFQSLSTITLL